ncbi:hypothetical protein [Zooshikella harenae]|uniref:MafI family immunity protein n=1 Tax=Zooshikella harenae TaxID=2827238 RepID=A0ABS5ZIU2_9GAMM|nr:hypothetical protein [Zooshikella harenae]MBU2713991.1 hypothetical protein [Zooshikella harenae]
MDKEKLKSYLKSLSEDELNAILDQRDEQNFDAAWCQVYEVVDEVEVDFDGESIFRELSEAVSQHEIVSYILDDLLLLEKSDAMGISPPFVEYLKSCYDSGKVPHKWKG